MEIMKYVDDAGHKALEDAKKTNHDINLEKLYDLIHE